MKAGGSGRAAAGWIRTTGPTSPVRPRGPGGPMGPGSPLRPSLPAAPAEPGGPYGSKEAVSTEVSPASHRGPGPRAAPRRMPQPWLGVVAQEGTYSWTSGTRSTRRTLFTRSALCKEREGKRGTLAPRSAPGCGAATPTATVTPWYLQEDRVGPGDRRSLGDPSCLCHPARQFHLCHHGDLGDPVGGGGDGLSGGQASHCPRIQGDAEARRRTQGGHQLTAGPRAPAGPGGPAGPAGPWDGREGDGSERSPILVVEHHPEQGAHDPFPGWESPSSGGSRAQGRILPRCGLAGGALAP